MNHYTWIPITSDGTITGEPARGHLTSREQAVAYIGGTPNPDYPDSVDWRVVNGKHYWLLLIVH
jgi:hypothetical protein